ncbi:hypothetical protein E4U25_005860 [Claviceps purpurea]|nr:hypothetical protein E4U25_005860 [Claviceps purpurea]
MALTKHVDDLKATSHIGGRISIADCLDFLLAKLVRGTNVNNFTKRQRVLLRSTSVLLDSPESLDSEPQPVLFVRIAECVIGVLVDDILTRSEPGENNNIRSCARVRIRIGLEDQYMDRGKRRTMNSLIAERDWSVQEAMNVLNDEDMVAVSRSFQNVDLRHPDHNEAQARVGADGVPTQYRSLYSKYLNRPVSKHDVPAPPSVRGLVPPVAHMHELRHRIVYLLLFYPLYGRQEERKDHARAVLMLHKPHLRFRPREGFVNDDPRAWTDTAPPSCCQELGEIPMHNPRHLPQRSVEIYARDHQMSTVGVRGTDEDGYTPISYEYDMTR